MTHKTLQEALELLRSGDLEALNRCTGGSPKLLTAVDGDGRGLVHHAVLARSHPALRWLLLDHQDDDGLVLMKDEAGWSCLHLASSIGDTEAVSLILCHPDAPKIVSAKNDQGNGPLHYAGSKGYTEIARLLVEGGADMLLANRYGQTALHRASALGHTALIDVLINGCPSKAGLIDARDGEGNTALHMACQEGHEAAVAMLLAAGARTDIRNADGKLAIKRM